MASLDMLINPNKYQKLPDNLTPYKDSSGKVDLNKAAADAASGKAVSSSLPQSNQEVIGKSGTFNVISNNNGGTTRYYGSNGRQSIVSSSPITSGQQEFANQEQRRIEAQKQYDAGGGIVGVSGSQSNVVGLSSQGVKQINDQPRDPVQQGVITSLVTGINNSILPFNINEKGQGQFNPFKPIGQNFANPNTVNLFDILTGNAQKKINSNLKAGEAIYDKMNPETRELTTGLGLSGLGLMGGALVAPVAGVLPAAGALVFTGVQGANVGKAVGGTVMTVGYGNPNISYSEEQIYADTAVKTAKKSLDAMQSDSNPIVGGSAVVTQFFTPFTIGLKAKEARDAVYSEAIQRGKSPSQADVISKYISTKHLSGASAGSIGGFVVANVGTEIIGQVGTNALFGALPVKSQAKGLINIEAAAKGFWGTAPAGFVEGVAYSNIEDNIMRQPSNVNKDVWYGLVGAASSGTLTGLGVGMSPKYLKPGTISLGKAADDFGLLIGGQGEAEGNILGSAIVKARGGAPRVNVSTVTGTFNIGGDSIYSPDSVKPRAPDGGSIQNAIDNLIGDGGKVNVSPNPNPNPNLPVPNTVQNSIYNQVSENVNNNVSNNIFANSNVGTSTSVVTAPLLPLLPFGFGGGDAFGGGGGSPRKRNKYYDEWGAALSIFTENQRYGRNIMTGTPFKNNKQLAKEYAAYNKKLSKAMLNDAVAQRKKQGYTNPFNDFGIGIANRVGFAKNNPFDFSDSQNIFATKKKKRK